MSPLPSSRRSLATLAGALTLFCGAATDAASIGGLTTTLNAGNTANMRDNGGAEAGEIISALTTVSSTGSTFLTRYSAGVFSDSGGNNANTNTITLNANYTITFNVTNATNQIWQLTVDTSRIGARTAIDDGAGSASFDLTAVVGSLSGPGSVTAGSLALAALNTGSPTNGSNSNLPFAQAGQALIQGVGNGTVSLTFTFSATATSTVVNDAGDEAAIRMGQEETLSQFDAGQYPGVGNRTQANDGHFVNAVISQIGVVPEPDTALLLAFGLAAVALQRRRALRRSA